MKKIICFGIFFLVLSAGLLPGKTAAAQSFPVYEVPGKKPELTPPDYVAMVFFKMSGQVPNFEAWARLTPAWQAASAFDKTMVQNEQVQILEQNYNLLALREPLIVETPVRLSQYSPSSHGFFVENFTTNTYFPVRHNDRSYAIIPQGIIDKQWLSVPDDATARAIETAARSSEDRWLTMVLHLVPKYVDKSAPLDINGQDHWMILTEVRKMMLFPAKDGVMLWETKEAAVDDRKRQELMNLFQ